MLVRLLVAVLMLAGPLPVRTCTCAAATSPCVPAESSARAASAESPRAETKRCGCRSSAAVEAVVEPAADTAPCLGSAQPDERTGHQHPERHDRDCPAVNPLPSVSAVLTPAADVPADSGLAPAPVVHTARPIELHVALKLQPCPAPTAVPLYISLLTLRN